MPWSALAAGLIAGVASGAMGAYSARQQQEQTIDAYKHRHQWQVADLRSAGLNPVLSATQGAGSVGSMAQMSTPDVAQSVSSASAANLAKEQALTAKTTQVQQLTQADVNESTAAHQAASAREANARADIAEQVSGAYKSNPELSQTRAISEAGLNPSNPLGFGGHFIHRADQFTRGLFSGDKYNNGGSINVTRPRQKWADKDFRAKWSARY